MTLPNFVAHQRLKASDLQAVRDAVAALSGLYPPLMAFKTSNESLSSNTTLQDDNELFVSIPDAGTYLFDLFLLYQQPAITDGDIKIAFTHPGGTVTFGTLGNSAAGGVEVGARIGETSSPTNVLTAGPQSFNSNLMVRGSYVASATGTFRLQWAQNTSDADATQVLAGSWMRVQRVA